MTPPATEHLLPVERELPSSLAHNALAVSTDDLLPVSAEETTPVKTAPTPPPTTANQQTAERFDQHATAEQQLTTTGGELATTTADEQLATAEQQLETSTTLATTTTTPPPPPPPSAPARVDSLAPKIAIAPERHTLPVADGKSGDGGAQPPAARPPSNAAVDTPRIVISPERWRTTSVSPGATARPRITIHTTRPPPSTTSQPPSTRRPPSPTTAAAATTRHRPPVWHNLHFTTDAPPAVNERRGGVKAQKAVCSRSPLLVQKAALKTRCILSNKKIACKTCFGVAQPLFIIEKHKTKAANSATCF